MSKTVEQLGSDYTISWNQFDQLAKEIRTLETTLTKFKNRIKTENKDLVLESLTGYIQNMKNALLILDEIEKAEECS